MTPNQLPPLPDGVTLEDLLIPLRAALETCHDSDWSLLQFKTPISHALAAIAQQAQPVHQFRRKLCADWYDGHPDHEDGGGPYETRILYATPPAPQPAPVGEREAFERWCGPFSELRRSDFDPGRYCHSGVSLAWDAWQARAAQPAPVVPDDVVRYRTIRDGLVYIEPHESGEIYVAGETGVYTKSGDEFDAAIDAIAASQQKGWSSG